MIYICMRIIAIIFLLVIIYMIVKDKLKIKYSILWLFFAIAIIVISFNIGLIEKVSDLLSIYYAPAMIFLFAIAFLILYILHLSIVVTKQERSIVNLIQEISLLKEKVERENKEIEKGSKKI